MPSGDNLRERLEQALSAGYRIEREMGGGGMSRVFLAEETALGRRVVVKVLSSDLAQELSAERFAREIRLSARLQHPNIVPVLAAGTAGDVPYYTMPFIDGESLRARLQRAAQGERIAVTQAVEILRDVARALAYAHKLGVVHRDIKPENVLIGYDAAVVADFGVAKAVVAARTQEASSTSPTLTRGGIALGTPAYMSPEQAAGDPDVDHRADVYAWGVVAYEMLSGRHPFADRHSIQALVTAHLVEQPKPLTEVAPHVPPPVSGFVMRCLAKSRDDRPSSAREIVEALGGSLTPDPNTRPTLVGRAQASRRRTRTAIVAALGIAVVTGAPSRTGCAPRGPPRRRSREPRRRARRGTTRTCAAR